MGVGNDAERDEFCFKCRGRFLDLVGKVPAARKAGICTKVAHDTWKGKQVNGIRGSPDEIFRFDLMQKSRVD